MSPTPFQKAYQSLNTLQKKAVDTIDGPVMVMAGPGTGKTQVLTLRIANILSRTDTDPSSILALTFTDNAAREMRTRLLNLVGQPGLYVRVTTFHAFCNDIISENPERFSRPAGLTAATDLDRIEVLTRILEDGSFLFLKPINNPTLYLPDIVARLSDLKREGISVKRFSQLVRSTTEEFEAERETLSKTAFAEKEKLVGKNVDLLAIYKKYQQELVKLGRFDYEDMINWVVEAFESDDEFLLGYQEKFQYILVDEYQDTNSAQNRLVFALAKFWGKEANVFVVGDPHQSIFRFQGASQENTNQFAKVFPNATQITLDQNYRSTSPVLNSAASLISSPPLSPNVSHQSLPIKVAKFNAEIYEDRFLIDSIKKKLKAGISPSDIAVIVKENKDLEHLVNLMKQHGLAYRLEGGANILTTPYVSQFLKILHLTTNLSGVIDDLDLFTVLNYPYFHLDPLAVLKAARLAQTKHLSLLDLLVGGDPDVDQKVQEVFARFVSWGQVAASATLSEVFQKILQESGLMDYLLGLPHPLTELNRFHTLYDDVKLQLANNPALDLAGFVKNLDLMVSHGLKLPELPLTSAAEAITLTTAHKAKGLEWLVVYIYRFADTHWGNKTIRQMIKLPPGILTTDVDKIEKNADERRLFYVALTRAKQEVYLSGSVNYSHSTRMTFPAMFLSNLPKEHLKEVKTDKYHQKATPIITDLLTSTTPVIHDGEDTFLQELIKNLKISPTALNTYLECHYKFKLDNLYRLPRAKAPAMCFGTAVHVALENLYRRLNQTGKPTSKKEFLADFGAALKREVLSKSELKDRLDHGQKILSAYYDHYQKKFKPSLFTEKNFGYHPVLLGDIPLSGKVDRVETVSGKKVRLVDYKTGAPKTRAALEKESDAVDGNYKRQLVFYQLLAGLDPSFTHEVVETELDFIEPDKTGAFHRERFTITPKEVNILKETIKDTAKQIRSLDFTRTKDVSICRRCDFLSHCYPHGLPSSADD